jgi:hypothetical protein
MRHLLAVGVVLALAGSIACSDKSPTAPTPAPESATSSVTPTPVPGAAAGASISGTVAAPGTSSAGYSTFTGTLFIQVVGSDVSSLVSANGSFELKGVPAGEVVLRIGGGDLDATLLVGSVGSGESVRLVIVVGGAVPVITSDSRVNAGQNKELEGTLQAKQPPAGLVVNNQIVEVAAGSTSIKHGSALLTYEDLAVGQRVHVRGTIRVAAGTTALVAGIIEVQQTSPPSPSAEVVVRGKIASLVDGSCDAKNLAFTVTPSSGQVRLIRTNDATGFSAPCVLLKVGTEVEVKGSEPAGAGAVLAAKVYFEPPTVSVSGTVAAVTAGSCGEKNLEFDVAATGVTASTKHVRTSASTVFSSPCLEIVVNAKVAVEGLALSGSDTITATKVTVKELPSVPISFVGIVSSIKSGSCGTAGVLFEATVVAINGGTTKRVQTDAGTVFSPSCGDVKEGAKVSVDGQTRGTSDVVFATKVTVTVPASTAVSFTAAVSQIAGGSCEAKNLVFDGTVVGVAAATRRVQTSGDTLFATPCSEVKVGAKVYVEGGIPAGSDTVRASKVMVTQAAGSMSVAGAISGLSSVAACPLVTFAVTASAVTPTSVSVQTQASTVFSPGCSALKNGDVVKVEGTKQGDKLVATVVKK